MPKAAAGRKPGRPTTYKPEVGKRICDLIADGYTLRQIAAQFKELPYKRTVLRWLYDMDDPLPYEQFRKDYARAREARTEAMADEIEEIADDGSNDWADREGIRVADHEHIQRSKLRVDTRKWLMSKMLPKKYGDHLAVEHSGDMTLAMLVGQAQELLAAEKAPLIEHEPAQDVVLQPENDDTTDP